MNGTQVATKAQTGTLATSANALQIGGDSYLRAVLRRPDRRGPHLQCRPERGADPGRHDSPIGSGGSSDTRAPDRADKPHGDRREFEPDQPLLDCVDRQRRCHGLPRRRCQGAGCSNFASVPRATAGNAYTDTGLSPNTTYRYRVRAVDAAPTSAATRTSRRHDASPAWRTSGPRRRLRLRRGRGNDRRRRLGHG